MRRTALSFAREKKSGLRAWWSVVTDAYATVERRREAFRTFCQYRTASPYMMLADAGIEEDEYERMRDVLGFGRPRPLPPSSLPGFVSCIGWIAVAGIMILTFRGS